MKDSLRTGVSFGLTSAVITTLGLMVGLHSGTHSKIVVLAGILLIAVADAFSDALGIHVSEEAENTHTAKQIWGATIATFLTKFLFAMTFLVPVLLLSLSTAIIEKGSGLRSCISLNRGLLYPYGEETQTACARWGVSHPFKRKRRRRHLFYQGRPLSLLSLA